MWRSPETEPLSVDERAGVRRLQIALCAVKQCPGCGKTLPVHAFDGYGATTCWCRDCNNAAELESWWSARKAALAS